MDHPIYFVRHGETEWNVAGRFQGQRDSRLTERGRGQADAVGRILAREIDDVTAMDFVVSPLGRTLETARIALAHIGVTPRHDQRLAELSVGKWTGMTHYEVCAEYPDMADVLSQPMWEFKSPEGETLDQAVGRAKDWLASVTRPTVAISHGLIGRLIRGAYRGLTPNEAMTLREQQGVVILLENGQERQIAL